MDEGGCVGCFVGSSFMGCTGFIVIVILLLFVFALLGA